MGNSTQTLTLARPTTCLLTALMAILSQLMAGTPNGLAQALIPGLSMNPPATSPTRKQTAALATLTATSTTIWK